MMEHTVGQIESLDEKIYNILIGDMESAYKHIQSAFDKMGTGFDKLTADEITELGIALDYSHSLLFEVAEMMDLYDKGDKEDEMS